MSKEIKNYKELEQVARKATLYFLTFIKEIILYRKEWENPKTKTAFIERFHNEYFAWEENCSIDRTRNRVNCAIRIIESHMVEDALEIVINSNEAKMDIYEARINAIETLEEIKSGKLKY